MRIRPRWRKILSDLWGNKVRSLLVIASIAVGLFAIGIIATIHTILLDDMQRGYAAINPANIQITTGAFDQDLVDLVRHIDGVREAEGFSAVSLRIKAGPEEWIAINFKAIADFDKMHIDQVHLEQGAWPPGKHEIVIERNKLPDTHAQIGDMVEIELPSGKTRRLKLVGAVQDQTIGASGIGGGFFLAPVQGYINQDTLEWLELPTTFNQLNITVTGNGNDEAYINEVANRVRNEVENSNRFIINKVIRRSEDHPNSTYVNAIAAVLFLLGLLVVFLSGFLITNTFSALMNQQLQQIGVMKTLGAQRAQVVAIYMRLIFFFGVLAFLIALPLAAQASYPLLEFLSQKINFSLYGFRIVPSVVALQLVIALIVPQGAGFIPILHGSGITVQEAISGFSQNHAVAARGWLDRKIHGLRVRSRPLLISLRNTFRRKGRLALTLVTLSLGGAIFIATFNVQVSLTRYIQQVSKYFLADVNLTLGRSYRIDKIQGELADLPGVARVEGWAQARSELILEDGSVGDSLRLLGPPAGSPLIEPILLSGRWIRPGDQNAIVLSERFLSRFPYIKVGDPLRLKVNGKDTDWVVVGFFQLAGKSGGFLAYTSYDYLSNLIHEPFKAPTYRIVASQPNLTLEEQKQFGQAIEAHLKDAGIRVSDVTAGLFLHTSAAKGLNILTIFLLIMAILTALVGSIGLMGTMSMNVLERTREIGVMRAIGANNRILMKLVIVEGILIGMISWLFGSLLAFPISKLMSDQVSRAIFDTPTSFSFTFTGFAIWLLVVMGLSLLASILPSRNAARLTIREVLAYE